MTEQELFARFVDEKFVRRGKSGRINRAYFPSMALAPTSEYEDLNEFLEQVAKEAAASDDPANHLIEIAGELKGYVDLLRMVAFDFQVFKDRLEENETQAGAA